MERDFSGDGVDGQERSAPTLKICDGNLGGGVNYSLKRNAATIAAMDTALDGDPLEALEKFIVENDDLPSLEAAIGRFNIFDALNIARVEIRHSNCLSFILDPAESHGQSHLFLKALLMDLLRSAPAASRPLSPIEVDGTDLRGVEVKREWENIDLLITCHQPAFVIAIENKVDSSEHSNQLAKYKATVAKHYSGAKPLFVYLTPNGEEPSEPEWVAYSYADLFRVLTRVRSTHSGAIGDDVLVFLDHYLNLIGTRFMDDAKITELCERIWKNHRQALQLIFDRVGNPSSGVLAEVEAVIRDDPRWNVFYRASDLVDFVPKDWMQWLPPIGTDKQDHPQSWIVLRFSLYSRSLDYYVEVRKMQDAELRKSIVDSLIQNCSRYGFVRKQAREVTNFYTRVSSRSRVLEFNEEEAPAGEIVRAAVKNRLEQVYPYMDELAKALRELLKDHAK